MQSKEFATGYLHTNQDMTVNHAQLKSIQSDVKNYTEVMDDEVIRGSVHADFDEAQHGKALLKKLAPQEHNSTGQVVVEVEKVVRDLSMLHKTIRMAKFYRILVGIMKSRLAADLDHIFPSTQFGFRRGRIAPSGHLHPSTPSSCI